MLNLFHLIWMYHLSLPDLNQVQQMVIFLSLKTRPMILPCPIKIPQNMRAVPPRMARRWSLIVRPDPFNR
jgi:hypothetical protein